MNSQPIDLIVVTGMSGAGKTVAVQSMEDLGYYCVDNLPPVLMPKFLELIEHSRDTINQVALVMDLRGREFFDAVLQALDELEQKHTFRYQILFLDASDNTLVQRYKETRRRHPLAADGLPLHGIQQERILLEDIKGRAQQVIDTSSLKPSQLRETILQRFSASEKSRLTLNTMSFGFKYGLPIDADLVFDVRFLANPNYVAELQNQTGLNEQVSAYVMKEQDTQAFLVKLIDMLSFLLPLYEREGKSQLVVAIGCTGGKHRSVALAEYIQDYFSTDYLTRVTHRDIDKDHPV